MEIFDTEIFGPVAPLFRFKDEAEAIRLANATPFGLAAYAYTRDIGRAMRVASHLAYGMIGMNDGLISTEVTPFGGIRNLASAVKAPWKASKNISASNTSPTAGWAIFELP